MISIRQLVSTTLTLTGFIASLLFCFSASAQEGFVGSEACGACHQQQSHDWQQSHHWHSMEEASVASVLGDFNNAQFDYFGTISTFFKRGEEFFVRTDNAQGELQEFEIKYTFGFEPLQQYLIEFDDGRIQALSISWDARSEAEGGQRWYHLYPNEQVDFENPLHWTGPFQNWNSQCASCHSTNLQKNYSLETNRFDTHFSEINVACESCHGPAQAHLEWADTKTSINNFGFEIAASEEACAFCHSRRAEISHNDLTLPFDDRVSLSMLSEGLYYPDGQVMDEVYVYGSFLQSKMHQNDVTCSNCHAPHTQELLFEGNDLCLQCHEPELNTEEHFFHEPETEGAQCINCHMPITRYMGVDDRRDHSFRIPDPLASAEFDSPNACTYCHAAEGEEWVFDQFFQMTRKNQSHYDHGTILSRARAGDTFVQSALLGLVSNEQKSVIIRATALNEARQYPSQETLNVVLDALESTEPLLRRNAVAALTFLPIENRYQALQPLVNDPVKSVRIEVARQLAGMPVEQLTPRLSRDLTSLFDEFVESALLNSDQPGAMTELGLFYFNNNDNEKAEQYFLQALALSPRFLATLLNLADLYRIENREEEGERLLQEALLHYPESANAHHALGLLYVRTSRVSLSLDHLKQASELSPDNARFVLVYSVALESVGELSKAISVLQEAVQRFPTNDQLYQILRDYSARR